MDRKKPTTKIPAVVRKSAANARSKARADIRRLDAALEENVEKGVAKVPVSSKVDPNLAREIELLIHSSGESMSQFVGVSLLNEYHRRKGTRAPRELTLVDLDRRLDALATEIEMVAFQSRIGNEMLAGICHAVGIDIPQVMKPLGKTEPKKKA